MTKKIISLCPHLQRFRKESPIGLEDVIFAIKEFRTKDEDYAQSDHRWIEKLNKWLAKEDLIEEFIWSWKLKTDYRNQSREVKDLVKNILAD